MIDDGLSLAQNTLKHRFEDFPDSAVSHVEMGLSLLEQLDQQKVDSIFSYVLQNFARRSSYELDEAARISGIQRSLVADLLTAVTLVIGSIFDLDVTKDDFFKFAPKPFQKPSVRSLIDNLLDQALAKKGQLKTEVEESKLASEVLPSFQHAHCAIDVRLKFDESDSVTAEVPVSVIYISTDSDTQEL